MTTKTTKTITYPASAYEDHDNCLEAARVDAAAEAGVEIWQCEVAWDSEEEREQIVVMITT